MRLPDAYRDGFTGKPLLLEFLIFHSDDGITPLTSFGRSMPVFCPSPNSVAYFAIRSIPSFFASV